MPDGQLSRILADQLLKCRFRHGGTQAEVATELGIARSTLAFAESGLGNPSMTLIVKLAKFYRVTLDDLICDPLNRKFIMFRQGEVTRSQITNFISVRQVLSHQNQIRLREFSIEQGQRLRLKPADRDWKELLICNQGLLDVAGFTKGVLLKPGQFLELIPEVEKKIWSIKGTAEATLIQIKDRSPNRLN